MYQGSNLFFQQATFASTFRLENASWLLKLTKYIHIICIYTRKIVPQVTQVTNKYIHIMYIYVYVNIYIYIYICIELGTAHGWMYFVYTYLYILGCSSTNDMFLMLVVQPILGIPANLKRVSQTGIFAQKLHRQIRGSSNSNSPPFGRYSRTLYSWLSKKWLVIQSYLKSTVFQKNITSKKNLANDTSSTCGSQKKVAMKYWILVDFLRRFCSIKKWHLTCHLNTKQRYQCKEPADLMFFRPPDSPVFVSCRGPKLRDSRKNPNHLKSRRFFRHPFWTYDHMTHQPWMMQRSMMKITHIHLEAWAKSQIVETTTPGYLKYSTSFNEQTIFRNSACWTHQAFLTNLHPQVISHPIVQSGSFTTCLPSSLSFIFLSFFLLFLHQLLFLVGNRLNSLRCAPHGVSFKFSDGSLYSRWIIHVYSKR